jgi:hypothetical protein
VKTDIVFVTILLSTSGWAAAQCVPGFPSCAPPDVVYGSQGLDAYGRPLSQSPSTRPGTSVAWEDRWGAIAIDSVLGKVGAAKGLRSKKMAERAALSDCVNRGGGSECQISLAYRNQCGVMAWGERSAVTHGAASIEEASAVALQRCGERTSDCIIYYADCSMSELVQQ